jgi:hypothetical protein
MATKIKTPELFNLSSNNTAATQLPVFTTSTRPIPTTSTVQVEYLAIGGGGAGGCWGGGGGAGGYLTNYGGSKIPLTSGLDYAVVVGEGGVKPFTSFPQTTRVAVNPGEDSSIIGTGISVIADGGGGGGGMVYGSSTTEFPAQNGGSGGGASAIRNATSGGSATAGQGNDGGDSPAQSPNYPGGGGGGGAFLAGGDGQSASGSPAYAAGNGGDGLASSITGTSITRAGGGGGFTYGVSVTNVSSGGTGGGGAGGRYVSSSDSYNPSQSDGEDGAANTGSGGGSASAAGSGSGSQWYGGLPGGGGSGIAILRYPTNSSPVIKTTGSLVYTQSTDGSDTVIQFTEGSGDVSFASAGIAVGEMIFNSTTEKVEYWDGFQWNMIKDESQPGPGDIFQDGSNLFTSNFSNSTLSSLESGITYRSYGRSGGNYFIDNTVPVFRNDVPSGRSGFGKSLTMTDTGDDPTIAIDGITPLSSVLTCSFWVYVVVHDNDDNTVLCVNLKRQNYSNMWVYIYEPNRSSYTNDSFSVLPTGSWQHMVVTKRSDNYVYTYKNNSLLGSINAGTKIPLPYGPFLGSANEFRLMHFADADVSNEVWITGVRIFNRGLTASEITTLYNENPTY